MYANLSLKMKEISKASKYHEDGCILTHTHTQRDFFKEMIASCRPLVIISSLCEYIAAMLIRIQLPECTPILPSLFVDPHPAMSVARTLSTHSWDWECQK